MVDNRTTELLREGLTERGIKWRSGLEGVTFVGDWCFVEYDNGRLAATCEPALTPEQAIAASLGSELNPDGLPVGLTISEDGELLNWHGENYVKQSTLWSGTLTAEQVRETVEKHWHDLPDEYDMPEATALPEYSYDWQAIADELNAELGSGTCEVECFDDGVDEGLDGEWFSYAPPTWYLSCGHTAQGTERPNFCPVCGKAVKR